MNQALKLSAMVKLDGPYVHAQLFLSYDHCDYELAVQILFASQQTGTNSATHLQFDSIRHLLTVYGNQVCAQSSSVTLSMADQKGRYQRLSTDSAGSLWFKRFAQGCKYCMGQQ